MYSLHSVRDPIRPHCPNDTQLLHGSLGPPVAGQGLGFGRLAFGPVQPTAWGRLDVAVQVSGGYWRSFLTLFEHHFISTILFFSSY